MSDCTLCLTVQDRVIADCLARIYSDLLANHDRDPAVRHAPLDCLLSVHATFFAVLCHRWPRASLVGGRRSRRLAHRPPCVQLLRSRQLRRRDTPGRNQRTSGDRSRLGTVIGQTVVLGDDAISSTSHSGRARGSPMPLTASATQQSGIASRFHPVRGYWDRSRSATIGFIGADAIVTQDLPANSRIVPRRGGCGDRPCLYAVQVSAATALTEGNHERRSSIASLADAGGARQHPRQDGTVQSRRKP